MCQIITVSVLEEDLHLTSYRPSDRFYKSAAFIGKRIPELLLLSVADVLESIIHFIV
jgi:hypothetical protein